MALTAAQQSAQDYINQASSGQGGTAAYIAKQQQKYAAASASGDSAMLDRLSADAARTGLSYNPTNPSIPAGSQPYIKADGSTGTQPIGTNGATQDIADRLAAQAKGNATTNTAASVPVQPQQQNNNSLISQIYDSMYNSQAQKLKALRDQQLAGLAGQDTIANNNAKAGLNANDVSGARNSNSLKEQLANLGLLKGGDYITQQTAQNAAQGQNANNINMDLATKLQQLSAQKDAINNNATADDLALLQSIQAQQGQAQLNDQYKQQDYGLNLSQLSGQLPGGGQTLAGQNQGFQQNLATNQFNQDVQNQQFNQGMANKQFDYQKVQDDIKNGQWSTQTENQMKQWAEGNKLNWAQFDQSTKQALAQIAISQQNASTSSASQSNSANNSNQSQLMDIWKATGKAPAGITGVATGTPYGVTGSTGIEPQPGDLNLDDYKGYIDKTFYSDQPVDPLNPYGPTHKVFDSVGARGYIIGLNMTDAQTDQLLKLNHLPTN